MKIKVGDIVRACDETLKDYHGKFGRVVDYIHPYIYVVKFENGEEIWLMAYQVERS